MTFHDSNRDPLVAAWAVNLFAPVEQAESILGDLHEEFSQVRSKWGAAAARRWYWRQTARTVAHVFDAGFRSAPWSTLAVVIGGFFLLRFAHGVPDWLLTALTDRYLLYWSNHFHAYVWLLKGMWIEYLIGSLFTGCVVALFANRREMVATSTLSLILYAMTVIGFVWFAAATGELPSFWNLLIGLMDTAAIILGGVIVRWHRSATTTRPRTN